MLCTVHQVHTLRSRVRCLCPACRIVGVCGGGGRAHSRIAARLKAPLRDRGQARSVHKYNDRLSRDRAAPRPAPVPGREAVEVCRVRVTVARVPVGPRRSRASARVSSAAGRRRVPPCGCAVARLAGSSAHRHAIQVFRLQHCTRIGTKHVSSGRPLGDPRPSNPRIQAIRTASPTPSVSNPGFHRFALFSACPVWQR